MDKTIYAQAVSRIRAMETKLLDSSKINRMIESSTADETMKILQETEYAEFMGNVKRAEDYEILLSEELKRVYSLIYDISPEKLIIDILSLRYDYHNIKVLLKAKALNKDFDYLLIPIGTVDIKTLKSSIDSEDYIDLSTNMREAIESVLKVFDFDKDPQKIDIYLDKYLYKEQLELSSKLNDPFVINYMKQLIDITNIKTFLRVKKQKKEKDFLNEVLIDGGKIDFDVYNNYYNDSNENFMNKISHTDYFDILREGIEEFNSTGSLNAFEKLSDNFMMKFIREAKYVSFGVEPIIAYVLAKETEIKVVRIIMVGKLNNVEPDVIKGRLRDMYV
jgi:V/A-type H+/Na+-transporting ATPase subunit C